MLPPGRVICPVRVAPYLYNILINNDNIEYWSDDAECSVLPSGLKFRHQMSVNNDGSGEYL